MAAMALAIVSCGRGGEPRVTLAVSVDSSGPYPVVRSTGTPPRWTAELIATVGADTGGPYEFGAITSVVLGGNGSLYVLDLTMRQLSAFDSLGMFTVRLGRRGRGPGEYRYPLSIAMLHDSVVVFDPDGRKYLLFEPGGTWMRDLPAAALTGPEDVILYRTPPDAFWTSGRFRQSGGISAVFVRHESAGAVDTITARRPQLARFPGVSCFVANGGISFYDAPFGPRRFARPTRSGSQAVAINSSYRVWFLSRTGDTLRALDRPVEPGPVPEGDWVEEIEKWQAWRTKAGNPQCTGAAFTRPETRPVLEWMFLDDVGQLWIESYTAEGHRYEVFGEDGALRAVVTGLPPSRGVDPSVAAGRIALSVPDSNDIPRVQVYRIRKP